MSFLSISVLTTEYIRVPVGLLDAGEPIDPSALPVQLAFPATDASPATWVTGSWEPDGPSSFAMTSAGVRIPLYSARTLVGPGPGGHPLPAGSYDVWVQITSSPEIPVRKVGVLEVK
jgi:hypothetical protein